MYTIQIKTLDDLRKAAEEFVQQMNHNTVFAFDGDMGAGKTTFIKAICQHLGVSENITSPTFAIVNEYIALNDQPIYHFDCYRLKNASEAHDIGAEEYFYSGNLCFIEWPDRIDDLLPNNVVWVKVNVKENQEREVTIQ